MFNFLNSVPVLGHAKGLFHYATGDTKAGNKAMKESTRSSVVMGAGAVGLAAGPVGSAMLGASAGVAWDTVESVTTNKMTGIIKGIDNIANTASKGKVPVNEILVTTVGVTVDAIGGMGGGSLASTVSNVSGQAAANTVGKSVAQSVGKSMGKSVGRSAGENILKSASVPVGETFGRTVAQSVGKSIGKSVTKTVIVEEVTHATIDQTACALMKTTANVLQDKLQQNQQGSGGLCRGYSSNGTGASSTGTGASSTGTGVSGASGNGQKPAKKCSNQTTCSQETPEPCMNKVVHYVTEGTQAGNIAMMESTLSSLGMGAGTVGFAVGTVGSVAPIIKLESVPAWGTFGKAVAQYVGKLVDKLVSKNVVVEEVTQATLEKTQIQQDQQSSGDSNSGSSSTGTGGGSSTGTGGGSSTGTGGGSSTGTGGGSSGTGTGGGGQKPPGKNPNQTTCSQQTKSFMDEFLEAFEKALNEINQSLVQNIQSLDQIYIRDQYIFRQLKSSQKKYLKRMIRALREECISLKKIIKTILNIFETVELKDVTFATFMNLMEFIMQYIAERMARNNQLGCFEYTEIVETVFSRHDYTTLDIFREIRTQMETRTLLINFRDIFTAVYHYFKHRYVGWRELSITQYYDLIEENLPIIMNTQEYSDLITNGRPVITFERYYGQYWRWFIIGIRVDVNVVVLSTSHFVGDSYEGEKDGDMYINNRRLP